MTFLPNILGIAIDFYLNAYYTRQMLTLSFISEQIAAKRKKLGLRQTELAQKAAVSRATIDALENGRLGELGFAKLTRILSVLGLELKLQDASPSRPTLDELMEEARNDKSLDRRR
jgi:transcriptional regulator with XRE-family HTH domain